MNLNKIWNHIQGINLVNKVLPLTIIRVETAEFDCLHDEAIEFAEKLKEANIDVIVNETKKTMHGYDLKNGKITREMVKKRMELISKV